MLQKFAEGAKSVSSDIEVKTVRLYDLDYKGCMSCMACKIKGKASNVCKFKAFVFPVAFVQRLQYDGSQEDAGSANGNNEWIA